MSRAEIESLVDVLNARYAGGERRQVMSAYEHMFAPYVVFGSIWPLRADHNAISARMASVGLSLAG